MSMLIVALLSFFLSWLAASLWLSLPLLSISLKAKKPADLLNLWLQNWQLLSSRGQGLNDLEDVPEYKFFSRLALTGLRHARTYGKFPRELLWEWREGLNRESQFDKKQRDLLMGSLFQFALFSLIIWIFIFVTGNHFKAQSQAVISVIVIIQLTGFCTFPLLVVALKKRTLTGLAEILESLYVLKSLSQAGLALSQVMQEAKLELIPVRLPQEQANLNLKLKDLAKIYVSQGSAVAQEAKILIEETWFLRTHLMQKLSTRLEAYKLVWLILFFGSSYALFLLNLISDLLQAS